MVMDMRDEGIGAYGHRGLFVFLRLQTLGVDCELKEPHDRGECRMSDHIDKDNFVSNSGHQIVSTSVSV